MILDARARERPVSLEQARERLSALDMPKLPQMLQLPFSVPKWLEGGREGGARLASRLRSSNVDSPVPANS